MKALIIAAGQGQRLSGLCASKPLLPVCRRPLIDWVIRGLQKAGIKEVIVVTGYNRDRLEEHLKTAFLPGEINLTLLYNDQWHKENGLSVFRARPLLKEPFFLLMSDHIFDPAILDQLRRSELKKDEIILAVDSRVENHPYVDLADVTRVKVENGKIMDIGKGLVDYNAFDTGIFFCQPVLFDALEESQRKAGDFSLSGGIKILATRGKARAMEIGGRFWIDVDDPKALERAESFLKNGVTWY
ncbi:MAG: CTP:Inositol-1-phosphate cytidylyltransferase [Candidatus Saccharicenans subterraneus]|uniref:CTP:Inositol-1-phosphate cytidylyltransferase n=1 Tax=Candidatus Saccharicenans subterraneus TaxID=2508984 RepID=A0A3E2BLS2_9BACT|nr:MAG: CTP:Inositol-1-phosphate cytidylyltransferase [Candidatus Saccharicenans subterraneum]